MRIDRMQRTALRAAADAERLKAMTEAHAE